MFNHSRNSSWKSALIGASPFMLWGIALISNEIPPEWTIHDWTRSGFDVLFFFILFLPSIGFGIAWIQGFPRWSYPYVTLAVIFSLYLTNASTPGIAFFGYPTFGRELWGWRAWVPLLIATVASLLISRSLRSVSKLFANVWSDLTLLTFGLFGLTPLLVAIFFDEMDRQYSLNFMVAFTLVAVATAVIYLRSSVLVKRILALVLGIVSVMIIMVLGPNVYWQSHGGMNPIPSIVAGIILTLMMITPSLIQYWRGLDQTLAV